jgi:hypothetical protein
LPQSRWPKQLLAAISTVALALGFVTAAQAVYQTPQAITAKVGESILSIDEVASGIPDSRREVLVWPNGVWDYANANNYLCPNEKIIAKEGGCDYTVGSKHFYISNIFPVCEAATDQFCVEGLEFEVGGKTYTGVHFDDAGGDTFDAVPSLGLQRGSQISLWKVAGVTNSAGVETFAVSVRSRQDYDSQIGRFKTISMDMAVFPYELKLGSYKAPTQTQYVNDAGLSKVSGGLPTGCSWSNEGECGAFAEFVGTPRVKVIVRSSADLSGWFRGRVSEQDIKVESIASGVNRVAVSGKPVSVPRFAVVANRENTPKAVQDLFPKGSGGTGLDLFEGNSGRGYFSTNREAYQLLEGMRPAVKDTAAGISTYWNVESIGPGGERCFQNATGFIGAVSTNATVYDGTAPAFVNGELTYKLAGLHYMPDGKTLNLGTYDLVMRSDIARCLYGFTNAPVSAKISVINDQGESVVATTVVSERDGWIKLAAYGFTYSEKEIKVQLTQEKSAAPVVAPKPAAKTILVSKAATKLSAAQLSSVKRFAISSGKKQFTCTGFYRLAKDKPAALSKAKQACSAASAAVKGTVVATSAVATKQTAYEGRVLVSVK